jgi:glycine/D-amino acid oxidase-like deaminating enzyme
VSRTYPFEEFSPWVDTRPEPEPALVDDLRADVVIIGGGYAGLSAALNLRSEGADVVVLERDFAGFGASGRNAGHLTPTIGKDLPTVLRFFGADRASALVRFADSAVEYTEEVIEKHQIDCAYARSGNILAGLHPKHEARLERAADTARGLGAKVRYLGGDEMRERGIPPAFTCGILEECGGTLNPGQYVRGLRAAALGAGVRLFEGTPVDTLEDGAPVVARAQRGSVTADSAVLATNAFTGSVGRLDRKVAPLRVSLFETAPLDDDSLAALGWRGREGIYTAHETLESYHPTARRTIVGGSKVVRYAWASGLAPGYDPAAFDVIGGAFRRRFPELHDVEIACYWGGWIGMTLDFLPAIGSDGSHDNVHYGIGFCGHGVAQATLVGQMLAQRCQGRSHPCEAALARRSLAWPPEPLRWAGARLLMAALDLADARTERQIRGLSGKTPSSRAA